MGQTSNPTLRYPDNTDRPRAVQLKNLAEDTHAAIVELRTLLNGIGAQQTYDPVWSGPVALNIGNGTKLGRYTKIGRRVTGFVQIVRGSTTNVGSGNYTFSLPVNAAAWNTVSGIGYIRLNGSIQGYGLTTIGAGTGTIGVSLTDGGARLSNSNRPGGGSWTSGDEIFVGFDYISES